MTQTHHEDGVGEDGAGEAGAVSQRVLTVPNLLSFARLLGAPVFFVLLLEPKIGGGNEDWWALGLIVFSSVSDYLDGKLARLWNQTSRLGQLLDPSADRLYILATLVGLAVRQIIPWWLVGVLVGRDLLLSCVIPVLSRYGYGPLPVHFLGKAATFNLMYAFPLLLLSDHTGTYARVAAVLGWAFAIWGTGLYLVAGALYVIQARHVVVAARGA
jgi:cardiolipin synthase